MSAKQRATTFHPLEAYSFANYLAYALYAPLYIAGPIMTFNDFMWQVRPPTPLLLCASPQLPDRPSGRTAGPPDRDLDAQERALRRALLGDAPHDGAGPALHVRRGHQGRARLGRGQRRRAQHDRILEPDGRVAQGLSNVLLFLIYLLKLDGLVVAAVAVLPAVGSPRRRRPARKHGPVHGEQLLHPRLLAELASLV